MANEQAEQGQQQQMPVAHVISTNKDVCINVANQDYPARFLTILHTKDDVVEYPFKTVSEAQPQEHIVQLASPELVLNKVLYENKQELETRKLEAALFFQPSNILIFLNDGVFFHDKSAITKIVSEFAKYPQHLGLLRCDMALTFSRTQNDEYQMRFDLESSDTICCMSSLVQQIKVIPTEANIDALAGKCILGYLPGPMFRKEYKFVKPNKDILTRLKRRSKATNVS